MSLVDDIKSLILIGELQELEILSSENNIRGLEVPYALDDLSKDMDADTLRRIIKWLNKNEIEIEIGTILEVLLYYEQFEKFELVVNSDVKFADDFNFNSLIKEAINLGSSGVPYLEVLETKLGETKPSIIQVEKSMRDENKDMYNFLSQKEGFEEGYEFARDNLFYFARDYDGSEEYDPALFKGM